MVKPLAQTKAKAAHDRRLLIIEIKLGVEHSFIELGKELSTFYINKEYINLGYRSFSAFIADPDVNISKRNAWRLIGNYQEYVLGLSCATEALVEVGTTKLELMRSRVTEDNVDEMLNMGATLSYSDLQAQLTGREPVIRDWKSQLREARQLARALSQNANVPQEVMEFSLDYWRQTEMFTD